jgi:hypothetical protein
MPGRKTSNSKNDIDDNINVVVKEIPDVAGTRSSRKEVLCLCKR